MYLHLLFVSILLINFLLSQIYCCHGDLVSNVKDNDQFESSLDKLAKDNSQNFLNVQSGGYSSLPDIEQGLLEKTRITPATNTIEESGGHLVEDTEKKAPTAQGENKSEWIKEAKQKPTGDDLLTNRRRKRDTEEFKEKIKISEKYTRSK